MKKKKGFVIEGRFYGFSLIILLTVLLILKPKGSVLGDRFENENGNIYNYNNNNGNSNSHGNGNQNYPASSPTVIVTSIPTQYVPPVLPTVTITRTATITPTSEPASTNNANENSQSGNQESATNNTSNSNDSSQFSNGQSGGKNEEVIVSVTQRSVVEGGVINKPLVTPTKSILKVIENKIKNVGTGEFLSKPKAVPTLPSTKDQTISAEVGLGPDSSIFYALLADSNVLLGAVDKNGTRLNVDSVELRGAELTMDKVLKSKGLDLGVTSENNLVLVDGDFKAYFNYPVYVDVFKHDVSVETQDGRKKIIKTPKQAIDVAYNEGKVLPNEDSKKMSIVIKNGSLYYQIFAKEQVWLFGKYQMNLNKTVLVDTESGEVSKVEDGLVNILLKSISR